MALSKSPVDLGNAATNMSSHTSAVYKCLKSAGCCKICCLRYLGEKDPSIILNVDDALAKMGLEEPQLFPGTKQLKQNTCIGCLDLFQESCNNEKLLGSIETAASAYDCDNFTCALSLPIAFQIRCHSLWIHLQESFPEVFTLKNSLHELGVMSIKETWKSIMGPIISKLIKKEFDSGVNTDFFICIDVSYTDEDEECRCFSALNSDKKKRQNHCDQPYTRKSMETLLQCIDKEAFSKYYPVPPPVPTKHVNYSGISCSHNSLFFAGRYCKYSRLLSQTPWLIDGERRMETSVQEIICDSIQLAAKATGTKFSSSGREDVDVRNLGRGRPFVCELLNPHRIKFTAKEMRDLEVKINADANGMVYIRDLQLVLKDNLGHLKLGEEEKVKQYTALCISLTPVLTSTLDKLSSMTDLTISQKTPIRVLHRRPLAIRPRKIYSMKASPIPDGFTGNGSTLFKLSIKTQAGTYIKEFVHGDFRRTTPSLRELLGDIDINIQALDVEDIDLDWPPALDYQ